MEDWINPHPALFYSVWSICHLEFTLCCLIIAPQDTDCVPCDSVQCPPTRRVCPGGHVTEPCGCCPQCARQRGQLCGGPHWSRGYCDRDLTCSQITGLLPATPPQTGVCKGMRSAKVLSSTAQRPQWYLLKQLIAILIQTMLN